MKFLSPVKSVAFSPTGEYVATAHEGSLGVFLWANQAYYRSVIVERQPEQARLLEGFDVAKAKDFYSKKFVDIEGIGEDEETKEVVRIDSLPELIQNEELSFSEIPFHRV